MARSQTRSLWWKKALLGLVVAGAFLCLLEGALALFGVRPILLTEDPFVGFESHVPLFVPKQRQDGTPVFRTALNKRPLFNFQEFLRQKPEGTVRIFCVGGSTTFGSPYEDPTSFCGWLRHLLPAADPSRTWDLVNAGGLSYASYRIAALMEELVSYEPDLFIIYTGHNEFLERRSYEGLMKTPGFLLRVASAASHTRLATVLRWALIRARLVPGKPKVPKDRAMLPSEVNAVLDNTIGPADYVRDEAWAAEVLEHFRVSLHRMIDIARKHGAQAVLVTPASNLADCSPFKSDGTDADEAYREGKSLLAEGKYEAAKAAFVRARDLDVCPLRAPSPFIEAVRAVARERRVPLVDFVALTEQAAEHGIPGRKEFLDHVHPTIDGHRRLALALVDVLIDRGHVSPCAAWGKDAIERVTRRVNGYVNREAHGRALRQLSKVLGWGGKFEESRWLALQALEFLPDDPESLFQVGAYSCILGDYEDAEEYLRRSIAVNPTYGRAHLWLARALTALGRHDEAEVSQRDALRLLPGDELDFEEPKEKPGAAP